MERKAARLESAREPAQEPEKAPKQEIERETHEMAVDRISRSRRQEREISRRPSLGLGR